MIEEAFDRRLCYNPFSPLLSFNVTFQRLIPERETSCGNEGLENVTKSPPGSGTRGTTINDAARGSVSVYSSSITCWYRIPVTAYTGWHGQNLLGPLGTLARTQIDVLYRTLSSTDPPILCSLSLSFSAPVSRPRNETGRHVDAYRRFDECHCVAIGRCFVSIFFSSPFFFSGGRWLDEIFFPTFRSFSRGG